MDGEWAGSAVNRRAMKAALISAWLAAALFTTPSALAQFACTGDCNLSNTVTVDEIILGVNIALGFRNRHDCPPMDSNNDNDVTVDELVQAVHYALDGCPPLVETCRSAAECSSGFRCLAPGESAGCGICRIFTSDCDSDAPCKSLGEQFICAPVPPDDCPCNAVLICQAGCLGAEQCGEGQSCDPGQRCVARLCNTESECEASFSCAPLPGDPEHSACMRTTCDSDSGCGDGFCVNQRCYSEIGICTPLQP